MYHYFEGYCVVKLKPKKLFQVKPLTQRYVTLLHSVIKFFKKIEKNQGAAVTVMLHGLLFFSCQKYVFESKKAKSVILFLMT